MESKQENILGLFFNEPTREWHFEEIVKEGRITRSKANRWLKQFIRTGLIRRVKSRGRMPYYLSNHDAPPYRNRKKLFALNRLYYSGFLDHLLSLPKARTIILFGSFVRSDWYKDSDIDLFIYGEPDGLKLAEYEIRLKRDIQVFACPGQKELRRFGEGLIRNIIKGNVIKGEVDFVRIELNA